MSIASEISRIQQAKADIKTAIEGKGVTVPSNALLSTYGTYVSQIEGGGGGSSADTQALIDLIERDAQALTIPSGTTKIGNNAFYRYSGMTSVTIPNTVTSIGTYAFAYCDKLTNIPIPSGVTSIDSYAFYYCEKLTNITIPSGITSIGSCTFLFCYSLTSVNIPSRVTSIGSQAFYRCTGLTSIDIPSGVTSIGNLAFEGCSGLTSITVERATPPTLGSNAFSNTNNCPIYVPSASVETYKGASVWSTYASRIQAKT